MSYDVAISLSGVSKHYTMYKRPEDRLKQMVIPKLMRLVGQRGTDYYTQFSAVQELSLNIPRGQTLGIVGRNGSGKSTLLQLICGTLTPSTGDVAVNGRIAALLELGAGFNPEFTGRENVYLNASIMGLSHDEIEARFERIEKFANIGQFIDHPVKTYSSGMYVRLAFAVSINVDPDVLVVDEALAVGDEAFQRKCFARLDEIRESGATILFVSHSAESVLQLCDRAIMMEAGEVLMDGVPKTVVHNYQKLLSMSEEQAVLARQELRRANLAKENLGLLSTESNQTPDASNLSETIEAEAQSWYDPSLVPETTVSYQENGARISDARFVNTRGETVNVLQIGQRYHYEYKVSFEKDVRDVIFGMQLKTLAGVILTGINNVSLRSEQPCQANAGQTLYVRFEFECRLLPGVYLTDTGLLSLRDEDGHFLHRVLDTTMFRVAPDSSSVSIGFFDFNPRMTVYSDQTKPMLDYARPQ